MTKSARLIKGVYKDSPAVEMWKTEHDSYFIDVNSGLILVNYDTYNQASLTFEKIVENIKETEEGKTSGISSRMYISLMCSSLLS